jgi:hypothetical protein
LRPKHHTLIQMATPDPNAIDKFRLEVRSELVRAFGEFKPDSDQKAQIVQLFYTTYFERFLNDNNKIWSTGNIFIPLSLAGLISLNSLALPYTCLLALGSMALMRFWVLVAENHRAFQTNAQTIMEAIEGYMGPTIKSGKLAPHRSIQHKLFGKLLFTVQNIRWQMFASVCVIWLLAVWFKAQEEYSFTCQPLLLAKKKEKPAEKASPMQPAPPKTK